MIPEAFKVRMKNMLGDDYADFIAALECGEAVRGARVNLVKCDEGYIPDIDGLHAEKIPYAAAGYILRGEGAVGHSAEHHAGMIYMQDPGAMAALTALDISPEWWVADLCAAPGGKSSQIAERLGEGGFLLSNEYVPKRAKIMVGNFERLGISRAMVTSLDTAKIAELYREAFDLVVADAPCSGEGMFRKSEEARSEWSVGAVVACATRQGEILDNAYKILKCGGKLLYSTCTWSREENEGAVLAFLKRHPDMRLIPVKEELAQATRAGIEVEVGYNLGLARRFYPHISEGEGQFIALMEKCGEPSYTQTILYKESVKAPSREEMRVVEDFFRDNLTDRPYGRLIKSQENILIIPHGCPLIPYSVFMSGVLVGEVRRGILHPSHHFFSVYGRLFKIQINLDKTDLRCESYLRGEEIDADVGRSGWCAVMYRDVPLGGGKVSGGRVKNHYPKGLRNTR